MLVPVLEHALRFGPKGGIVSKHERIFEVSIKEFFVEF